jgi:hypothetical protein
MTGVEMVSATPLPEAAAIPVRLDSQEVKVFQIRP